MGDLDDLANAVSSRHKAGTLNYSSPGIHRKLKGPLIVCSNPNCGYRGKSIKTSRGSMFALIFLLFLGLLPGIIYMMFFQGWVITCPQCGMKVRDTLSRSGN